MTASEVGTTPIAAVLCDLDDTLFPQADWLDGAWRAVAEAAAEQGVPQGPFLKALHEIAAEGSARGGITARMCSVPSVSRIPVRLASSS